MLDDGNDLDGSTPSLDSEFGVPIMRTPGVKKALSSASEKLRRSSREKNPVTRLGYNEYMAHHYAFAMKAVAEQELTSSTASLHQRLEGEKPDPTIKPEPKPATRSRSRQLNSNPKPAIKLEPEPNRRRRHRKETIPAIQCRCRLYKAEADSIDSNRNRPSDAKAGYP